jgi:hypothetical protein
MTREEKIAGVFVCLALIGVGIIVGLEFKSRRARRDAEEQKKLQTETDRRQTEKMEYKAREAIDDVLEGAHDSDESRERTNRFLQRMRGVAEDEASDSGDPEVPMRP